MTEEVSPTGAFIEQWRDHAYACFSSGHKFCRNVCPVMGVTQNENHSPTAFHANVVAMEQGLVSLEDVARDYVHCTQCGACETRCPNTLMAGDFYRHRTRTVDVVKAVRALAVDNGIEQPGWKHWVDETVRARTEPVLDVPIEQERVAEWADGLDLPIGGETILFVDCEAAFYRTSLPKAVAGVLKAAGVEFGLMREQWCCGGPAREMGYVARSREFAEHNLADWRATGVRRVIALDPHDYIAFTEDYPEYFAEPGSAKRSEDLRSGGLAEPGSAKRSEDLRSGGLAEPGSAKRSEDLPSRIVGDDYDIEIVYITELVAELIREGRLQLTVPIDAVATYHDPCRLNKRKGIHESPREILRAIPGLEFRDVDHVTQWAYCSGAGGGLPVERPDLTAAISAQRLDHAANLEVDTLVSQCVWSERPLSKAGADRGIEVRDLLEMVAESAGVNGQAEGTA
jgi:heterodisulfide reductase subunit D